jgi:hypothetical protein
VSPDTGVTGSFGATDPNTIASSLVAYLPVADGLVWGGVLLTTEPVNPLYIGGYSVGPYSTGSVAPSGSAMAPTYVWANGITGVNAFPYTVGDAASVCGDGSDGAADAPTVLANSGWWNGQLCAYGHASYYAAAVRPNRSFTVEVTALDEQGNATLTKARPVIGIFAPSDAPYALPSVAVAGEAFQALVLGTTSLTAQTGTLNSVRVGIADERNDGRPDFFYQARFFYADTLAPAQVAAAGATAIVSGSGFRAGNAVLVNGVPATVISTTENAITLTLPTMAAAGAASGLAVDVEIVDRRTGATSTLSGALTYTSAAQLPASLSLVSAPSAAAYTGVIAPVAFAVREVQADGITAVAGEPIVFTVPNGAGSFSACGQATCSLFTNAQGVASSTLMPLTAGVLTMTASDALNASLTVSATMPVIVSAGSMRVLSTPASGVYTTQTAPNPFAVQMLSPTGAAMPGRSVHFRVSAGAARLSGCNCSDELLTTDSNGSVQVSVTPISVGTITLQAADGAVAQQTSLQALSYADTMQLLASPASGQLPNQWSGSFSIQLMHGDGATPDAYEPVTMSGTPGSSFGNCSSNSCTLTTDGQGKLSTQVLAHQAGTFTVTATFGGASRSATFSDLPANQQMLVLSAPSGSQPINKVAAVPFTLQVIDGYGNPVGWTPVTLATPPGAAFLAACNGNSCNLNTDGNGMVTTSVTPLRPGEITISALCNYQIASASFTGAGGLSTLTIVQQPVTGGATVGVPATFAVRELAADGVTPVANDFIYFSVANGTLTFIQCGYAACRVQTDQNGYAPIVGVPESTGAEAVLATNGDLSATMSFVASGPTDVLQVVSAPASGAAAGTVAALPFSVQVYQTDGVTPAAGRSVTLAVTAGSASFAGCNPAACVLVTDSAGKVSAPVTPVAAGAITLTASEGGGSASATFTAVIPPVAAPSPDTIVDVSAPQGSTPVGSANATPFAVKIFAGDGVTPAVGRAVGLAVTAGSASLSGCPALPCTLFSDSNGSVSTAVTGLAAGQITVTATETSLPANSISAGFTAVAVPVIPPPVHEVLNLVSTSGSSVFVSMTTATAFAVKLTLADGVTPVAGVAVTFQSATDAGQVSFTACSTGASCAILTDASGLAATTVTGAVAGTLTLTASAPTTTGGAVPPVSIPFLVVADQFSLVATNGQRWLAEGAIASLDLSAAAAENGAPAAGQAVAWSESGEAQLISGQTNTLSDGSVAAVFEVGALTAGNSASVTACAWTSVCTTFNFTGVSAQSLQVSVASGGWQQVSLAAATPSLPVIALVTDASGHPVIAAMVVLYQTVTAMPIACPSRGRCPAEAVLASQTSVLTTDSAGHVSFLPLTLGGAAAANTQTQIALAAGASGFATTVFTTLP